MATHPAGQPMPEKKEQGPRFSAETVRLGNTIFDGVSAFDEKTTSMTVRLIKSAQAIGELTHQQTFHDLSKELQSYLMFRVHDEEKKEKEYYDLRIEDERRRMEEDDMKYLLKERLHPEDDKDQIEQLERQLRDNTK